MSHSESKSQFGLWPLALSDNCHDSRPHPARRLFERLMRRAVLVVKVVIAVVLEYGLRHNRVTLAERRRSVEDFSSGVGHNVGFSILHTGLRSASQYYPRRWCHESKRGCMGDHTLFASFFKPSYACSTFTRSQLRLLISTSIIVDLPDQHLQASAP